MSDESERELRLTLESALDKIERLEGEVVRLREELADARREAGDEYSGLRAAPEVRFYTKDEMRTIHNVITNLTDDLSAALALTTTLGPR